MRTKVFDYEGSQAVIIPEEFHFDAKHIEIESEGDSLIITPILDNDGRQESYIQSMMENASDETFIRHPQGEHREIIW